MGPPQSARLGVSPACALTQGAPASLSFLICTVGALEGSPLSYQEGCTGGQVWGEGTGSGAFGGGR